jgi:DNA-binding PadR family transcriptional regulator
MPMQPDMRHRGDLDVFVLALIDSGISTPYDLQRSAGLSPGATIPALRRLVAAGFVLAGKPGPRGRTEHRVSAAGRRHLKKGWEPLIDAGPSGDLDADLRVALLALVVGADRTAAIGFLRQAAAYKDPPVANRDDTQDLSSLPPLARLYRTLRMDAGKALDRAESGAALAMTETLTSVRTRKPKHASRKSKP